MGQKINPISLRLQVNKDWRSKWFASNQEYTEFLRQDLEVRREIEKKFAGRAAINQIDISRSPSLNTITIFTAKAGVIIGRGGVGIEEVKKLIEKIMQVPVRINIEEVKKPELYAKLVAENISRQLENRIPYRRAVKFAMSNAMQAGAKGIKIEVSGRVNNADMARKEKSSQGSVPLQTLRADIDYALSVAHAPGVGTIGVKVWINKGEKF